MTLLAPAFRGATTVTVRDDIVTSDRLFVPGYGFNTMAGSVALDTDYRATYEEIVRRQLWVRIAVNKLAYGVGRLPLKTYLRTGDDERQRVRDSPLAQLMARPNETKETGNPAGFWSRVGQDLYTYANAVILKAQTRPDQVPMSLLPMSPRGWMVDGDQYIWRHPLTGEEKQYPAWKIVHIMEPGPTVYGFGVSRLEAARLTLAIEFAAQRLGAATFQNGARPSSIINVKSLPTGPGVDRKTVVERFKAEIMARFGGVNRAGLPAVLEGDIDWKTVSHNLDESAVVAHRQLTREEVAALYDIPQPAIGILDNANFASVDMLHIMYYQDTLGWPIELIEAAVARQIVDGVPELADQYVEFDLAAVMRGDLATRFAAYQRALPWMTPNEIRGRENLPAHPDPDADSLHFPHGVAPDAAVLEGQQNTPGQNTSTGAYSLNGANHA